MDSGLSNKLSK